MKFDMKALGEKAKGYLKTAGANVTKATADVRERADQAAERVAAKVTELTGRETTAKEVKQAAVVVAGVVVVGTLAASSAQSRGSLLQSAVATGTGSDLSWGSDFESQTSKFFADNGCSLNYYTPYVDSAGTTYYEPNG